MLRRLFTIFVAATALALGTGAASASDSLTIVDTLGAATPAVQFSVFGAGGITVSPSELWGPRFTLTGPTVLTEIGGFFNHCGALDQYVPNCPARSPFLVRIYAAAPDGTPDPSMLLATHALSFVDDPLRFSYESVNPNSVLPAGTYFALFGAQDGALGSSLMSATEPFTYRSGHFVTGFLNFVTGNARVSPQENSAVRILGHPVQSNGPSELAGNGGFEGDIGLFWRGLHERGGDSVFATNSADPHGGSQNAEITSTDDSTSLARYLSAMIPVDAGASYRFSAYLRAAGIEGEGRLDLTFWDAAGTYIPESAVSSVDAGQSVSGTTGWTALGLEAPAPPGATFARLEVRLYGTGTLSVDDASFTAMS